MHRLLRRQLRKHLGVEGEVPAALQSFVAAVDSAYTDFDSDRAMVERSQELSSKELSEAHDKAAQAQTRLTDALETISEGFFLFDASDRMVLCNSRYRELYPGLADLMRLGLEFEHLIKTVVERGIVPDAAARPQEWIEHRLARHRNPGGPFLHHQWDGRWIQISERKTQDGGTVGVFTDVTEIKRREEELAAARDKATEAQRRLVDAIESISEGFSLYDADDRLVIYNRRYRDMHGTGSIDVVKQGVSFEAILRNATASGEIPDAEGRVEAWIAERLARHRDPKGTHIQHRSDGRWIQINERKTDDGGTVATYTDITDVKQAEQAIQESEQRLRVIAEAAPMAVAIVTFDDGIIRYANQRFSEMFELEGSSALGLQAKNFYADPQHRERFIDALTEHGHVESMEMLLKRAGGEEFWALLASQRVQFEGRPAMINGLADISDRKRMEGELHKAIWASEQATRAKSNFVASMSHELRTPLNAIIGYSEILFEDAQSAGRESEMADLRKIQDAGKHLLGLIDNILDLSKIEAGKMTIEAIDFDLHATLHNGLRLFDITVREKGLELVLDFDAGCPTWVHADPVRIKQILVNIVGNAVKFTAEGSVRVLVSQPTSGTLRFEVRDTGIGIAAAKLQSIFDAFTQADGSHTRQFGGTGLGLAITRRLVNLMNGRLWAESQVGHGSQFFVELPMACGAPPQEGKLVPEPSPGQLCPSLNILVAEDNPINQKVIGSMLRRQGWTVTLSANGREAFQRYLCGYFDLILMDIQMPEVDGLEATRLIRQEESRRAEAGDLALPTNGDTPCRPSRIPVIALTAHASQSHHDQCITAGMNAVITKPVNLAALLQGISRSLGCSASNTAA